VRKQTRHGGQPDFRAAVPGKKSRRAPARPR
jgi:hypothetical protein